MVEYGGFEGNAQTLRIVSQLEKKVVKSGDFNALERRCGLNLTYRMLAAILKYDKMIPEKRDPKKRKHAEKGYYFEDKPVVDDIKNCVIDEKNPSFEFKSIECAIMDLADDIAYSTYDLEDSFKAGFLNPRNVLASSGDIFERVAAKVAKATGSAFTGPDAWDIFLDMFIEHVDDERYEENIDSDDYSITAKLANAIWLTSEINTVAEDGRIRTEFTSSLVGEFVDSVEFELNADYPALSKISVPLKTRQKIETLKRFTYEATIRSSRLRLAEHRGHEIVGKIFDALAKDGGHALLPKDQIKLWNASGSRQQKMRVISDFIAGMTDRYALEFYGRLYSDNPVSMFKSA